jgi:triosephosphate isomerase
MGARRPLLAGNWKMYKTRVEALALATGLRETVGSLDDRDVAVFPPLTALAGVLDALAGSSIGVGVQCGRPEPEGAFTGAVSMPQIADSGATLVLCGHSERRHVFGEKDEQVGAQVVAALAAGLTPYLCVGETIEERQAGDTWTTVERQLATGLAGVSDADVARCVIAYEPVWAIGTGHTATPEQAQEVHAAIRAWLRDRAPGGEGLRVLYGGSVKPGNAAELMAAEDIDGALVGGASLDVESFSAIVRYDSPGE